MARRYCTVDDVRSFLPANVVIEGENPNPNWMNPNNETVLEINIDYFIDMASDRIDMFLGSVYDTPLKKTNVDGIIRYPFAITYICSVLTAQMIYAQRLQGSDHQRSEVQEQREKDVAAQIASIQNGEAVLKGQRSRGHRFVSSTLYNTPYNPAQGGRSQNGGK